MLCCSPMVQNSCEPAAVFQQRGLWICLPPVNDRSSTESGERKWAAMYLFQLKFSNSLNELDFLQLFVVAKGSVSLWTPWNCPCFFFFYNLDNGGNLFLFCFQVTRSTLLRINVTTGLPICPMVPCSCTVLTFVFYVITPEMLTILMNHSWISV